MSSRGIAVFGKKFRSRAPVPALPAESWRLEPPFLPRLLLPAGTALPRGAKARNGAIAGLPMHQLRLGGGRCVARGAVLVQHANAPAHRQTETALLGFLAAARSAAKARSSCNQIGSLITLDGLPSDAPRAAFFVTPFMGFFS